jgi:hypothetical protein
MQTGCFDHILCMLTFSFDLTTVIYWYDLWTMLHIQYGGNTRSRRASGPLWPCHQRCSGHLYIMQEMAHPNRNEIPLLSHWHVPNAPTTCTYIWARLRKYWYWFCSVVHIRHKACCVSITVVSDHFVSKTIVLQCDKWCMQLSPFKSLLSVWKSPWPAWWGWCCCYLASRWLSL